MIEASCIPVGPNAAEFLTAAQSAFDATLESYRHGLETYVDLSNAQRNLDAAVRAACESDHRSRSATAGL